MSTTPVERLNAALKGRYTIERELGEGGMATVYLAEDLKHERKVALKVLKPELAAVVGAERFLAEIKTTANLQHPHILPLFDSGEADGFVFYVMPYVEGESLRDRLDRERQLPVDDAVRIASDLAEALEYAHGHGVIHRDIKPANILIQAGRPVIADFGIALAVGVAGGGRLTETGLSVGTPHYMSPEQATGDQAVGPTTDIYAVGCVLYEMLVGEPPYTGGTAQAILSKILMGDSVSATGHRESVPLNVDAAIRKALEKVPADRFASAQDFARALGDPGFRHGAPIERELVAIAGPWRWVSVALGAVTLALAGAILWFPSGPVPPNPIQRFELRYGLNGMVPVMLPDGSGMLLRSADEGDEYQLWLRRWNELALRPVLGTEGVGTGSPVSSAAISPDGGEMAFIADGQLKVVAFETGGLRTLADSVFCCPRWESDGFLYFTGAGVNIDRVPATGGAVQAVTQRGQDEAPHSDFNLLPGGEVGVFYVWGRTYGDEQIEAIRLATGERREVGPGMRPFVTPTGSLVFASTQGQILAAPFDSETMQFSGPTLTLVEGVSVNAVPYPMYSVSTSGTLVYQTDVAGSTVEFVWVTRSGEATPVDPGWALDRPSSTNFGWRLSPDDSRLALWLDRDGNVDVWIKELPDGPFSRLTFDGATDRSPRWHPSGQTLTFRSDRGDGLDLWSKRADGIGTSELLVDFDRDITLGFWSPDAEWLVLRTAARSGLTSGRDIFAIRPGVDSEPLPIVATEAVEQAPALSPDGRWLAYSSNETGRNEVFIRPFPEVDEGKWQVSTEGGIRPLWAHNGRELFFVNPQTRELLAADIVTEPGFQIVEKRPLFTIPPGTIVSANGDFYDIDSEDERFLMARTFNGDREVQATAELILVQNWFEEWKERMGGN